MKNQLKRCYILKFVLATVFFAVACSFSVNAQDGFTVTGNITDELGLSLPGASVLEKGTTNGVSSDFDGNYTIEVSSQNATLVISYIGYARQEVPVNGNSQIDLALESTASTLEEVVLVGYGVVKKKDLTGSIAQVDATSLTHKSTNSLTDVLRGNVAGLNIGFSASPQGTSEIRIRGTNSLGASSAPLIVVDGMIYAGNLSDINPADIEKLDVMKDASSSAVYGARGAGGVILVSTKKGTSEKPTIKINSSVGWATDAIVEKPYSAAGYVDWRSDVFKSINPQSTIDNPGRYDDPNNLPAGVSLDQWLAYDGSAGDPTRAWLNRLGFQDVEIGNFLEGKSIDWYDRIMQTGFRNDNNISISGRTNGLNYYWSLGRQSNEGIINGSKFETLRSRLNLDAKITDWLTVGMNTQYSKRDNGFISAEQLQVSRSSPWGSEFDDEGNIRLSPQDDNGSGARNAFLQPLFNSRVDLDNTFNSRVYAKVKLPWGFSYELGYTNRLDFEEYYAFSSSANPENAVGTGQRWNQKITEWQLDNILRWNKTMGKHNFGFTFLLYAEKFETYTTIANSNTFEPSDALGFSNLQAGTVPTVFTDDEESTGDAFMTRLNYNFDSRYLLTMTLRRDGYSAFGANNKRAYFPSVAGGWTISNEDFFKSNVIDFLKLRVSYGENGNRGFGTTRSITTTRNGFRTFDANRGLGRYAQLSEISGGKFLNVNENGGVFTVPTLNNNTQENNDLRWERTRAVNLGLDFSLLGGIVEGSFEAYKNVTDDLIVARQLPNIIGFDQVFTNLGEIQNQGVEFQVATQNFNKENFKWSTSFNIASNKNKINALYGDLDESGNELDDVTNQRFIGQAVDVIWDFEELGIWQLDEATEAAAVGLFPGDFKIRDVNNDGVFDNDDKVFQGSRSPKVTWAMSNMFTLYKNIDFSFEVYSSLGQKRVYNEAQNRNGFIDRTNSVQTPYWTPENPLNDYARLFSSQGSAAFNIYRKSSFVRLSNITLAYRFPKAVTNKLTLNSLRVYLNARNVAVWAPDWDLFDPEGANINGASRDVDTGLFNGNGRVPTPRYFTIGIDISL